MHAVRRKNPTWEEVVEVDRFFRRRWRTVGIFMTGTVLAAAAAGVGTVRADDSAPIVMTATITVSGADHGSYQVQQTAQQLQQDHACQLTSASPRYGAFNTAAFGIPGVAGVNAVGFLGKTTHLPHGHNAGGTLNLRRKLWVAGEMMYYGPKNAARFKRIGSGTVTFSSDGHSGSFDFTSLGYVRGNGHVVKHGTVHWHGAWSCPTVRIETRND